MVWLPDGEKKFDDMFSHFDKIPSHGKNGRTDRQTSCDSMVHAMHSITR